MIEGNLLIRASAGTGKTFSLATRYIRLMLFDGVAPERIVALTFSRAAAQEIHVKILERLWKAASDDAHAQEERMNLEAGLSPRQLNEVDAKHIAWTPATFTDLLKKVIDAQHSGAIATLDSFILRIVRNFPLELGFQNAVEVLDGAGEKDAIAKAINDVLQRTEGIDGFVRAFRAASGGKLPRVLASALTHMMDFEGWWKFILEHPESRFWTTDSMMAALGIDNDVGFGGLSDLALSPHLIALGKTAADKNLMKFAESLVRLEAGACPNFSGKTIAAEFLRAVVRHPDRPSFEHIKSNGEVERFEYSAEVFAAAYADVRTLVNAFLRRQLEVVEAKLRLFAEIGGVYDVKMRRQGKLTFADFTKYSAEKEDSERGLALQNLEFRFDSQFDHWALDEFQDTSEVQWKCLERLVDSAAHQGGGRTVIAVGDLKQSIYTWRGGDEAPFKSMMTWGAFRDGLGAIADANVSHRYQKHTGDFVNAVFGPSNLRANDDIPASRRGAVDRWLAEDCWKDHEPERDASGRPRANDYVRVVGVPVVDGAAAKILEAVMPVLFEQLEPVWLEHERISSPEHIGILVRVNDEGLAIAEYLRTRGLPVVWEGLNAVSDVPVVQAVLNLLKLADHPEDAFAWEFVNQLLPVREILFPDMLDRSLVAERVAKDLSHSGLMRTLKDYCGRLCEQSNGLDALSRERLRALVRAGVDYERRRPRDFGVDGFARFLKAMGTREVSSSARVIRILTIHRSKGLTLDRVFVPVCESDESSIIRPKTGGVVYGKGRNWVLPHVPDDVAAMNRAIAAVVEEQGDERLLETLRTYYVALTRSRKALYVIQPMAQDAQVHFRTLVARAVRAFPSREERGWRVLYEAGEEPAFMAAPPAPMPHSMWEHDGARHVAVRVSPSQAGGGVPGGTTTPVSSLFSADYGAAAQHGLDVHTAYQKIEWADDETAARLPVAFREAFVRPDDIATVWRERGYEIFDGRRWETGRFDRVVFTGPLQTRHATIYDFKTNARGIDESPAIFACRIRETYASQMNAYRHALAALTGIPVGRIDTKLLLEATGQVIEIKF